jgi:hypothetical protein
MGGATKANDNVMRIERSLLRSRAAMDSVVFRSPLFWGASVHLFPVARLEWLAS